MRNKFKLCCLVIFSLLFSGCQYDYNMNITEDLSVEETIDAKYTLDAYPEEESMTPIDIYNQSKEEEKEILLNANYNIEDKSDSSKIDLIITRTSNFMSFKNSILDYLYDKVESYCTNDKCVFNASLSEDRQDDIGEGIGMNVDYKIKFTVPYRVINNNADEVDLQKNTFIWYYINSAKKSSINLIFEKNGPNIIVANKNSRIFWISVWVIVGSAVMILIIKFINIIRRTSKPNF